MTSKPQMHNWNCVTRKCENCGMSMADARQALLGRNPALYSQCQVQAAPAEPTFIDCGKNRFKPTNRERKRLQ